MENQSNNVSMQNVDVNSVDYIDAIKTLKENTVEKTAYLKLKEENKKLLTSLVNGETVNAAPAQKVDINELRKELFSKDLSNLEFADKALKLREELIANGQKDPFLPYGKNILPTNDDISTANRVAQALTECVEYADGNSDIFTSELQRLTVDTMPLNRRK